MGSSEKAGTLGGGPEKNRDKGKRRGKSQCLCPCSPPPMLKVKNRLCGERQTECEQSSKERRERSRRPRGKLPQASARMRGRQRRPLLPATGRGSGLTFRCLVRTGGAVCPQRRAAQCTPTQLASPGSGHPWLAG